MYLFYLGREHRGDEAKTHEARSKERWTDLGIINSLHDTTKVCLSYWHALPCISPCYLALYLAISLL